VGIGFADEVRIERTLGTGRGQRIRAGLAVCGLSGIVGRAGRVGLLTGDLYSAGRAGAERIFAERAGESAAALCARAAAGDVAA